VTIDEARAQIADIRLTCRIAHLADLRDGETIDFHVDEPGLELVSVAVSRPMPEGFVTYRAPDGERLIEVGGRQKVHAAMRRAAQVREQSSGHGRDESDRPEPAGPRVPHVRQRQCPLAELVRGRS
jgi:hypothetical protein